MEDYDSEFKMQSKQTKRERWNEYMRNYRAKQKREQQELRDNPTHIPLEYNGKKLYCNCAEVRDLLLRYNDLLITLYNLNLHNFDDNTTDVLNANIHDYIKFSKTLVKAFEELVYHSPLTASGLNTFN